MYGIYFVTLSMLLLILAMLLREEKRIKDNTTHGLANKFWILRERRNFVRFNEEVRIRYNLRRNSPNFNHSKTVNVSRKGLCLVTYEKLKEKSYLDLEMDIPGFSKPVTLTGQVSWMKDLRAQDAQGRRLFYVGVKFGKINPESEAILLTHLNNLKRT